MNKILIACKIGNDSILKMKITLFFNKRTSYSFTVYLFPVVILSAFLFHLLVYKTNILVLLEAPL